MMSSRDMMMDMVDRLVSLREGSMEVLQIGQYDIVWSAYQRGGEYEVHLADSDHTENVPYTDEVALARAIVDGTAY